MKQVPPRLSSIPRLQEALRKGSWLDPSGYDAGKKVRGRKRHILVDTLGLLLNVVVHLADVQDRDGAFHLLRRARCLIPAFDGAVFSQGWKDALWDRFCTGAPRCSAAIRMTVERQSG